MNLDIKYVISDTYGLILAIEFGGHVPTPTYIRVDIPRQVSAIHMAKTAVPGLFEKVCPSFWRQAYLDRLARSK